jgi:hypothetical protein
MKMPTSKQLSEKQKGWLSRRRSHCGGSSPKSAEASGKPKGTILNAVPPAKVIKMTPLEEEMATSPNEEILSAVSGHSPTEAMWSANSRQATPTNVTGLWSRSSASLAHRPKTDKREDSNSRIGVWVNGVAQWDEDALHFRALMDEPRIEEEIGFTPLRNIPSMNPSGPIQRPNLSVVIPGNESKVDMSLSTLVQPKPRRPVVSVAPAGFVFNMTPTITVEEPHNVSPLEPISSQPTPSLPPRPSKVPYLDFPATNEQVPSSRTSSTASSDAEHDTDASECSKRSSRTSVEVAPPFKEKSKKRLSGNLLSSPTGKPEHPARADINKPLPPNPIPFPDRSAPAPPLARSQEIGRKSRQTRSMRTHAARRALRPTRYRPNMSGRSRSLTQLDMMDREFMRASPYASNLSRPSSPTLSEAEYELRTQLTGLTLGTMTPEELIEENEEDPTVSRLGSVRRTDSVRVAPERAPTLPRRSRKREWRLAASYMHSARHSTGSLPSRRKSESEAKQSSTQSFGSESDASNVRRSLSAAQFTVRCQTRQPKQLPDTSEDDTMKVPCFPRIVIDDGLIVVHGPEAFGADGQKLAPTAVAAASAEEVLLRILSSLSSTEDLFNMAMINKGMYRVFKDNEMDIIRTVSFNQSPAAWEFREWCPPVPETIESSEDASQLEHTPKTYLECRARDMEVIKNLKHAILSRCQSFIRRETVMALANPLHAMAPRLDEAFWRISCFCKIFGCDKGREDDITGQLDWLKGGLLAHNQEFTATVNTNLDFDMSSVLLNPPEHFAKGNEGGLTAEQLYDMLEIWTCLSALMQGYQGRVVQARAAGLFADTEIEDISEEKEEHVLDEWISYLLTLGPAVVMEMSENANNKNAAGFALAKVNGWTIWNLPQYSGSRSTFLKEPVSRLYEERISRAAAELQNTAEQQHKEMSRKRVASMAAEIRLRRQSSTYRRSPYIDMNNERPMSMVSRRSSTASSRSQRSVASQQQQQIARRTIAASPVSAITPIAPNFSSLRPMAPRPLSPTWSPRRISPIIEDRVETFNRMSLQNYGGGVAEDTSAVAVQKIVDMGFSAAQAAEALKVTDMGDGLRVDRAVDLLLRQRS